MTWIFDIGENAFLKSATSSAWMTGQWIKRGDTKNFRIAIFKDRVPYTLVDVTKMVFVVKESSDDSAPALILAPTGAWTFEGGYWIADMAVDGIALQALLDGKDSLSLFGEFTITTEADGTHTSQSLSLTVENDLWKGTEGTPLVLPTPEEWLDDRAVRKDSPQSNTEAEVIQALKNIGHNFLDYDPLAAAQSGYQASGFGQYDGDPIGAIPPLAFVSAGLWVGGSYTMTESGGSYTLDHAVNGEVATSTVAASPDLATWTASGLYDFIPSLTFAAYSRPKTTGKYAITTEGGWTNTGDDTDPLWVRSATKEELDAETAAREAGDKAPYWVEVVLTAAGVNIATGTKVAMVTHMQAGTITGFKIVCDPANEPSGSSVEVDCNSINLSTGAVISRLSSVASIAVAANISTGGVISGTQTVAVGDQSTFDIDQGTTGRELRALIQITPS